MKKLVMILMVFLLFVVVFIKIENTLLYYSVFALLALLGLIYYYITDHISIKAISQELKTSDFFVIKAGIVKSDPRGLHLIKGALVVYSGLVLFYTRKSSAGGVKVYDSFSLDELSEYALDNYSKTQNGISFTLNSGEVKKYSCAKILEQEKSLRSAIGYED